MIPYLLAAVGGYLLGDSMKEKKLPDEAIFADGGTIGSEGFTIAEMRKLLQEKLPYSFAFKVYPLKKGIHITPDYDATGYGGLDDSDIKQKLYFPQYKRDHEINYEVRQGDENTTFDFLLNSEKGDYYVGSFGFKDRGEVSSDYVTKFLAFLQEQYGLPFQIEHTVFAKGGMVSIKRKYEKNEDENMHSENVVLLAKNFGTPEELQEAKQILATHNKEGYLSMEQGRKRFELHQKLLEQARKEMSKEGIEFADGGVMAMAHGGDVDGYKIKYGDVAYKPYGKTRGKFKITYMADGKKQSEISESKEMALDTAKRYKKIEEFSNIEVFDESGKKII